jgi:hypothetical protein
MCGDSVRPCHYTVLGVARCASAADIYAAYHKKVEVSAVHTRAFPLVTNVTRMRGGGARRSYAGRSAVFSFFCGTCCRSGGWRGILRRQRNPGQLFAR